MKKKKKCTLFVLFCLCVVKMGAQELTLEERLTQIEQGLRRQTEKQKFMPQIHGILRGKYEYEPDLNASRFEVRNARLSVDGNMLLKSSYKLEVDLCDESAIKMKDAWVRVNPISTFRITLGQQRMPFSIDAHRNPSAQFFANRSFIAKQVGDMRDVGAAVGYDIISMENRKILSVDAGIYNGSNLDNQKTAWFTSPAYSARIQYFPVRGLALIPSVQHQLIASRNASYTSIDFGAYYMRWLFTRYQLRKVIWVVLAIFSVTITWTIIVMERRDLLKVPLDYCNLMPSVIDSQQDSPFM